MYSIGKWWHSSGETNAQKTARLQLWNVSCEPSKVLSVQPSVFPELVASNVMVKNRQFASNSLILVNLQRGGWSSVESSKYNTANIPSDFVFLTVRRDQERQKRLKALRVRGGELCAAGAPSGPLGHPGTAATHEPPKECKCHHCLGYRHSHTGGMWKTRYTLFACCGVGFYFVPARPVRLL